MKTAATTPTPDVTLANLNAVFAKTATQSAVSSRYPRTRSSFLRPTTTPPITPRSRRALRTSTFRSPIHRRPSSLSTPQRGLQSAAVTLPLEMKAMHDEMGGVYDTQFGRMSGMLGLSNPRSPIHVLIPYGLASPPTDLVKGSLDGSPDRGTARRHPDLEDFPQRRGYPHHPHPPVPFSTRQPAWPGRDPVARMTPSSWAGKTPSG